MSGSVTVGIDIGTTAVKALAVDAEGTVLARARIPHRLITPAPDRLEHDAARAWRQGPLRALAQVAGEEAVAGVCVASMVPSLTAVDSRGVPRAPGLLYGDARGRAPAGRPGGGGPPRAADAMPDAEGFVAWAVREHPGARGYWPAQAVANYALGRVPAIDTGMAMCMGSMRAGTTWDPDVLAAFPVEERQLPVVVPMGEAAGAVRAAGPRRGATGAVLSGGTVDALCDQIVCGASEPGDVLVICGATLIVWAVTDDWLEAPGLWTVPHTVAGKVLVGGPSNAGALFVDWARALLSQGAHTTARRPRPAPRPGDPEPARQGDPAAVPVWTPYVRGERAPYHDTTLRAGLHDLDITHDAAAAERAAYEASGFVVRHILERAGIAARRIVASGGGTQVLAWMQAMADAAGLPVDTVAVPEGAALGAAYVARWTAGLESSLDGAQRWARVGRRVEPDVRWQAAADGRYARFKALSPPA
ncbi:MAG TPA: FGGY-family carbohydrate kinase [Acidimicrobiales bacterium]|nr:FGGY-family carbohydrate kinase [Acidimicrobiales bacterium]